MNDASRMAALAKSAGKWTILGSIFALVAFAGASCSSDDKGGGNTSPNQNLDLDDSSDDDSSSATDDSSDDDTSTSDDDSSDDDSSSATDDDSSDDDSSDDDTSTSDDDSSSHGSSMITDVPFSEACPNFETDYAECGSTATAAHQVKVNLLLVVDKSGSMANLPTGYSENLWLSTTAALENVLTGVKDLMNIGLELYPYPESESVPIKPDCTDNCCEMPAQNDMNVPIGPGGRTVESIVSTLHDTSPGGGTPTAVALQQALLYLQGARLEGDTYVVLATDGGPNCNGDNSCEVDACTTNIDGHCAHEDTNCCAEVPTGCLDSDNTTEAIQNLRNAGYKTYVVGIPGSEPYEPVLNDFAEAGGVPNEDPANPDVKYYRVSASGGVNALQATFETITEQLVTSCTLPLTDEPPDSQLVNVAIDCTLISQTADDGTVNWELSGDGLSVEIQGDECTRITDNGVRRVDVLLGCPTRTLG